MSERNTREYNKDRNKKTEVVNVRVSNSQKSNIKDICEKLKLSQSEVLRLAIEQLIEQHCG